MRSIYSSPDCTGAVVPDYSSQTLYPSACGYYSEDNANLKVQCVQEGSTHDPSANPPRVPSVVPTSVPLTVSPTNSPTLVSPTNSPTAAPIPASGTPNVLPTTVSLDYAKGFIKHSYNFDRECSVAQFSAYYQTGTCKKIIIGSSTYYVKHGYVLSNGKISLYQSYFTTSDCAQSFTSYPGDPFNVSTSCTVLPQGNNDLLSQKYGFVTEIPSVSKGGYTIRLVYVYLSTAIFNII